MVAELADLIQVIAGGGALLGAAAAAWRKGANLDTAARGAALGAVAGTYVALLAWLLKMVTE